MTIRILQNVGAMNVGGAETWLMHLLRRMDRDAYRMDFLVHTDRPSAYDEEIRALGSRVLSCPRISRPWAYARDFARLMAREGPWDVVHSHVYHFCGFVLRSAQRAGVPARIAHSHLDTEQADRRASIPRRVYRTASISAC